MPLTNFVNILKYLKTKCCLKYEYILFIFKVFEKEITMNFNIYRNNLEDILVQSFQELNKSIIMEWFNAISTAIYKRFLKEAFVVLLHRKDFLKKISL